MNVCYKCTLPCKLTNWPEEDASLLPTLFPWDGVCYWNLCSAGHPVNLLVSPVCVVIARITDVCMTLPAFDMVTGIQIGPHSFVMPAFTHWAIVSTPCVSSFPSFLLFMYNCMHVYMVCSGMYMLVWGIVCVRVRICLKLMSSIPLPPSSLRNSRQHTQRSSVWLVFLMSFLWGALPLPSGDGIISTSQP